MASFFSSLASKLELHYFLKDQSHSMNAIVKNKCEFELLNVFAGVASQLDVSVEIESEALDKGGILEIWKLLGESSNQITMVILLITLILSRIPLTNQKLEHLKETELNLSIEEKQLNIEKIKKEIELNKHKDSDLDRLLEILEGNLKIRKHISNFYHFLMSYSKVSKIGTKGIDDNNNEVVPQKLIERKDFYKFILQTDELSAEIDENAIVEIISPVLKQGNYKWKGIYENTYITFYMKDSDFRNSVIKDGVKFKNGTDIECVLEKSRKIDDLGNIIISGYAVTTVIRKFDDVESFRTPQGEKFLRIKKEKQKQYEMFVKKD